MLHQLLKGFCKYNERVPMHSSIQVRTLFMEQVLQIPWSMWAKDVLAYLNAVKEKIHS